MSFVGNYAGGVLPSMMIKEEIKKIKVKSKCKVCKGKGHLGGSSMFGFEPCPECVGGVI